MIRVPQEPNHFAPRKKFRGVVLPFPLDFRNLKDQPEQIRTQILEGYIDVCIKSSLRLCTESSAIADPLQTLTIPLDIFGKHHELEVHVDTIDILLVRWASMSRLYAIRSSYQ